MKRELTRRDGSTLRFRAVPNPRGEPTEEMAIEEIARGAEEPRARVLLDRKAIELLRAALYEHDLHQGTTKHLNHVRLVAFGVPLLELRVTGEVYVRGEKVDSNPAIYEELRAWMAKANLHTEDVPAGDLPKAPDFQAPPHASESKL
jgi:hypothetical protein